jgi:hypothetical protein
MAVFMEREVYPKNPEYLTFGVAWVDLPDKPLDHDAVNYQAFVFVRYLVGRLGEAFLSDLWKAAAGGTETSAVEALDSLVPKALGGLPFANASKPDLFASGYCMDAYFVWDPANFAHDVYLRHRERAIEGSLDLKPGQTGEISGELWHLACRYYRVRPAAGAGAVSVKLVSASPNIKVETAGATATGKGGPAVQLRLGEPCTLSFQGLDHVVLVVANCGIKGATGGPPCDPEDRQSYRVELCGVP